MDTRSVIYICYIVIYNILQISSMLRSHDTKQSCINDAKLEFMKSISYTAVYLLCLSAILSF